MGDADRLPLYHPGYMPTAWQADSIGPVDVAVIQFEGDRFDSDVAPALADLSDSGPGPAVRG